MNDLNTSQTAGLLVATVALTVAAMLFGLWNSQQLAAHQPLEQPSAAAIDELSTASAGRGAKLYTNCVACHGENGHGKLEIGAPALAGQSSWYVVNQLRKFRSGLRGAHPDDDRGLFMRPMARSLKNEQELADVAAYVSALEPKVQKPVLEGDPEKGKALFVGCIACHGDKAQGNAMLQAPGLTNLSDVYMLAQMQKFRSGLRGTDPTDTTGMQMRAFIMTLPDEQALIDVIAYIRTLGD